VEALRSQRRRGCSCPAAEGRRGGGVQREPPAGCRSCSSSEAQRRRTTAPPGLPDPPPLGGRGGGAGRPPLTPASSSGSGGNSLGLSSTRSPPAAPDGGAPGERPRDTRRTGRSSGLRSSSRRCSRRRRRRHEVGSARALPLESPPPRLLQDRAGPFLDLAGPEPRASGRGRHPLSPRSHGAWSDPAPGGTGGSERGNLRVAWPGAPGLILPSARLSGAVPEAPAPP